MLLKPIPRDFYAQNTIVVAKQLLGKLLVHATTDNIKIGKIVEVEAYLGAHDLAAHSCRGVTPRTKIMFGPPGYAYVYLIYGMHHCMNVVTEPEGNGAAILIRALEPIQSLETRTQGPGLLCKAMGITKQCYGADLLGKELFISENPIQEKITIIKKPRIGVGYAKEWAKKLLRFYIKDNQFISKK